jgi:hypothetical protein
VLPVDHVFNDGPPVDSNWSVWGKSLVRKHLSLGVKRKEKQLRPSEFLANLFNEGTLSVRVRDFSMESQDNEFDLTGFRRAFSEFALHCYSDQPAILQAIKSYLEAFEPSESGENVP